MRVDSLGRKIVPSQHTHKITHGGSFKYPSTFQCWRDMKDRCYNKNCVSFKDYGGRGIVVCERWLSFANFFSDMGERPKGMTIDRKDNDGNYKPSNCRWATQEEQQNNRRDCVFISYLGKTQTIAQWAREICVYPSTLRARLNRNWPLDKALSNKRYSKHGTEIARRKGPDVPG